MNFWQTSIQILQKEVLIMSERTWTPDQQDAIDARNGTLIVSAAAGSGKTAVLVERIIQRLTDTENPCPADRLLIVTFTRAATAEMRSRISVALEQALSKNPYDENLQRQQMLLPSAKIYTIDAFCNDIVRENFESLGIAPDFALLDESESKILQKQAVETVIEELYEEDSVEFKALVELLFAGRDDSSLEDNIIKLYGYSRAYPSPSAWLNESIRYYNPDLPLCESPIGKVIADSLTERFESYIADAEYALAELDTRPEFIDSKGRSILATECELCRKVRDLISGCEFDKAIKLAATLQKATWSMPKGTTEDPDVIRAKEARTKCKDLLAKELPSLLCETEDEWKDDLAFLQPIVCKLIDATLRFEAELMRLKDEKNAYDFSDIAQFALKLLVTDPAADTIAPTPLALDISQQFDEILIDEYQDTNKAQDTIFRAISRSEQNLFMVGDVKQSIYGFRQAMPQIFLDKKKSFAPYDRAQDAYPACVSLGKNFRSREGITEYINFVFAQLMSERCGDVEYDESEQLVYGASYEPMSDPDVELHLIREPDKLTDDRSALEREAEFIARYICSKVQTNGEKYSDFAILMQSTKDRAPVIEKIMKQYGIPVYTETGDSYLNSADISTVISLLRIIDNPLQDIPLLSVLLSPIFAFTPDEVSQLRINERKAGRHGTSLYSALLNAETAGDAKCADFLKRLRLYRRLAVSLPAGELIRKIYEDTLYPDIVGAMPNGTQRTANLHLFQTYADNFDQTNSFGISSFVRYLDKLIENDVDPSSASTLSENANVVRIMTIHKSKGLEFKYCILANVGKEFNRMDLIQNLILHPTLGIGLNGRDIKTGNTYPTLGHKAVQIATDNNNVSETLRVLYVALTRAREHLVIVGSPTGNSKLESLINACSKELKGSEPVSPFTVKSSKSFLKWLVLATLRHPNADVLREELGGYHTVLPGGNGLATFIHNNPEDFEFDDDILFDAEELTDELNTPQELQDFADDELVSEIKARMDYEYPYLALASVATKRAASNMEGDAFDEKFFATARPEFASQQGLTPAQRGSALHKFMQYADYKQAGTDFGSELQRLTDHGFLTKREADVVDPKKVSEFTNSDIYKRMSQSNDLMREKKFAVLVPAGKFNPELPPPLSDEPVLIQGIADCVFEENGSYIIVDYKTDREADEEELIARHSAQLATYVDALAECLPHPVSAAYIYSFSLGKELRVI